MNDFLERFQEVKIELGHKQSVSIVQLVENLDFEYWHIRHNLPFCCKGTELEPPATGQANMKDMAWQCPKCAKYYWLTLKELKDG